MQADTVSNTASAEARADRDGSTGSLVRLPVEHCLKTGPDTLAGRYLRSVWLPVYHSIDLAAGRAVPLCIMSQEFTLYRSQTGKACLVDGRCAHRGTQLSSGWIEGDAIRCMYHGWKFGPDGRCLEQPVEKPDFSAKVAIGGYPAREYLGLIFAYLGEGEPPEFPLYPEFENFSGLVEIDSYLRECNYFNNLDNAMDMGHVGFVHNDNPASFSGIGGSEGVSAVESIWGVNYSYTRPDGKRRVHHFGMPNMFYFNALPTDPEIGWQESLIWWVPIDDTRHLQFMLHRIPASPAAAERIHQRREQWRAGIEIPHQTLCEEILSGNVSLRGVDADRVDLVRLQDDVAQVGQGRVAPRAKERLGRGDVGVVMMRRLWTRELEKLRQGQPLHRWKRDATIVPYAWGLEGENARTGGEGFVADASMAARIVDVRPAVEIELELRALHGRGGPGGPGAFQ